MAKKRATQSSWRTSPPPSARESLGFDAVFTDAEAGLLMLGAVPAEMDDKWFVYFNDGWLHFHRSWTGFHIYALRLDGSPGGVRVTDSWVNREPDQVLQHRHRVRPSAGALPDRSPPARKGRERSGSAAGGWRRQAARRRLTSTGPRDRAAQRHDDRWSGSGLRGRAPTRTGGQPWARPRSPDARAGSSPRQSRRRGSRRRRGASSRQWA